MACVLVLYSPVRWAAHPGRRTHRLLCKCGLCRQNVGAAGFTLLASLCCYTESMVSEELVSMSVFVPRHVREGLKDLAVSTDRSMLWHIRQALEVYLENRGLKYPGSRY